MAYTLTRNLKLRVDSNLTANSKYNLERIDQLAAAFLVNSADVLTLRSASDITVEPNSTDVGGTGTGGTLYLGGHLLDRVSLNATAVEVPVSLGLLDTGTSGTRYLRLKYNSTLTGAVDTTADRILSMDLEGADRQLVIGGNLSLTGGNLGLTLTADTSVTLPTSGTLTTLGYVDSLVPAQAGNAGKFLQTDGTSTSWATASGGGGGGGSYSTTWLTAAGTTKVVTHSLGTTDVVVSVIDLDDNMVISVESIEITGSNTVTLTSTEAPATSWKVVVLS